MPFHSNQKEVLFNTSFDKLFNSAEKVGDFFNKNGYKVEVSHTTSNINSSKFLKIFHLTGVTISIDIYVIKDLEQRSLLKVITKFDYTSHNHHKFMSLNSEAAGYFNDKVVLAIRNLLDNNVSLDSDLDELTMHDISSNDKRNMSIFTYFIFFAMLLFIYFLVYYFTSN